MHFGFSICDFFYHCFSVEVKMLLGWEHLDTDSSVMICTKSGDSMQRKFCMYTVLKIWARFCGLVWLSCCHLKQAFRTTVLAYTEKEMSNRLWWQLYTLEYILVCFVEPIQCITNIVMLNNLVIFIMVIIKKTLCYLFMVSYHHQDIITKDNCIE